VFLFDGHVDGVFEESSFRRLESPDEMLRYFRFREVVQGRASSSPAVDLTPGSRAPPSPASRSLDRPREFPHAVDRPATYRGPSGREIGRAAARQHLPLVPAFLYSPASTIESREQTEAGNTPGRKRLWPG
jgi:hypothetical protein